MKWLSKWLIKHLKNFIKHPITFLVALSYTLCEAWFVVYVLPESFGFVILAFLALIGNFFHGRHIDKYYLKGITEDNVVKKEDVALRLREVQQLGMWAPTYAYLEDYINELGEGKL